MAIFPLTPDQNIAQMWSNGVRGPLTQGLRYRAACEICIAAYGNFEEP